METSTMRARAPARRIVASACRTPMCSVRRNAASAVSRDHIPIARQRVLTTSGAGSVRVFDHKVGTANRAGQPRLLPRELELRKLFGDFHPVGELEADRAFPG